VWDVRTGVELFASPPGVAVSLAVFGPDGDKVFAGALNGTVRVWDTATRAEVMTLTGHTGQLYTIAFNAARDRVVTASVDRTARIWNARTGHLLHVLRHPQGVTAAGFNPDGDRVVTACDDKVVRVWDAGTGVELLALPQSVPVNVTAFSPRDGNRLLIGGRGERVVRVLDLAARLELLVLRHPAGVTAAAFSPDGERIVTGGSDGTLRVWDVATGDEILPIPTSSSGVTSVSFSPDGSRLLAVRTGPTGRSPPVAWVRLFGTRVPIHREESAVLIWDGTPLNQSVPVGKN
jgi:WD40 repeat protein